VRDAGRVDRAYELESACAYVVEQPVARSANARSPRGERSFMDEFTLDNIAALRDPVKSVTL